MWVNHYISFWVNKNLWVSRLLQVCLWPFFFCFSQPALSNLLDSSQEKCPYWLTSLNEFFYHEINQNYSDILVRFFGCRKNCEKNNKCYHSLSILHYCTIWMKKKWNISCLGIFSFDWFLFSCIKVTLDHANIDRSNSYVKMGPY